MHDRRRFFAVYDLRPPFTDLRRTEDLVWRLHMLARGWEPTWRSCMRDRYLEKLLFSCILCILLSRFSVSFLASFSHLFPSSIFFKIVFQSHPSFLLTAWALS